MTVRWVSARGGLSLHLWLRRFIWGCVNYENNLNLTQDWRKSIFFLIFIFMRRSKPSMAWIYKKWIGKLLEKVEWIGSYSWSLWAIEVKYVSKRNRFRYSTPVCMMPWLKATNDNRFVLNSFDRLYLLLAYVDVF